MKVGIVGLPGVGKTTIFSLLTGLQVDPYAQEVHRGVAKVSDWRVDFLAKLHNPKKVTYASLEFFDTMALKVKDQKERTKVFNAIQGVDALLIVLGAFKGDVAALSEGLSPIAQLRITLDELMFRDLDVVLGRIERLENAKRKLEPREEVELKLLKRVQEFLEGENLLSSLPLSDDERKMLGGFSLATLKPIAVAVNLDEEEFIAGTYDAKDEVLSICGKNGFSYVELCGKLEMEMNALSEEERAELLRDLGVEESGVHRLSRALYSQVGLISFFTAGREEVRAWNLRRGGTALDAAGVIHSDLARGFIKAEIIKFDDLHRLGSERAVRDAGLARLVGKEYVVEDGDIVTIRFNV